MNRTGRATRRSRLLTVLGIVLAALIAGGCLLFTDHLLGLQQEKLLSQVHFFPQEETDTVEETALEPEQIATILRYQDTNNSYDHLHDPKSGQINMEQAITAAKDGLEYFCANDVLPEKLFENGIMTISASLAVRAPDDQIDVSAIPAEYSFWTVWLESDTVDAELRINAVTGKIWWMSVYSYGEINFNGVDIPTALEQYTNYLGVSGAGETVQAGNTAAVAYELSLNPEGAIRILTVDEQLYAVGEKGSVFSDREIYYISFCLASAL